MLEEDCLPGNRGIDVEDAEECRQIAQYQRQDTGVTGGGKQGRTWPGDGPKSRRKKNLTGRELCRLRVMCNHRRRVCPVKLLMYGGSGF